MDEWEKKNFIVAMGKLCTLLISEFLRETENMNCVILDIEN